jgi:hypothetical protein
MSELTNIADVPAKAERDDINFKIAAAELEKLNLQIQELKPRRKWSEQLGAVIPIITATISIAGFLLGVVIFSKQQEKDRITREADQISRDQAQYRSDYEQLLQFSSNQNMTVSRVLFLQEDLNNLIDSIYPANQKLVDNQREKEKLAKSIFNLIHKDCDFTQTRQVQFDIVAMRDSVGYQKGLKGSQSSLVIPKYLAALRELQSKNPRELENIRKIEYDEFQEPEALLGDPYRSIIEGFGCHLALLTDDERAKAIRGFTSITKNPILSADLFSPGSGLICP